MNMNESAKALILQGLRRKKQTRIWLAEQMNLHKSWATRLLNGQIKSLSDQQTEKIMSILEINFFNLSKVDGSKITATAMMIATEYDSSPAFAAVASALRLALRGVVYTPRYIPTEKMSSTGEQIIAIVEANKEKPGKIARLVLELLA